MVYLPLAICARYHLQRSKNFMAWGQMQLEY